MNPQTITSLTLIGLLSAFSACEGEPPKVPTNPPASPPTEVAPSAADSAPATTPMAGPAGEAGMTACHCPCMGGDAHGAMLEAAGSNPARTEADAGVATPTPTLPAATPVAASAAPTAAAAHAISGTVTAVPAREAATSVVYLEDAGIVANRGALAGVDNHGMSFSPYISVIVAGGRVVFSNSDPFPHNIFSPDNERFNLGTVQMKASTAHTFKAPGVYSLLCNLHPNMLGYVMVSPSSYFAKTNGKGQFTIKDVPAGKYKITAWAPRLPPITQAVDVTNADATVDFALHR